MSDANLRKIFQKYLPDAHWQSIETWSTGRGVPDLAYCFKGDYKIWDGHPMGQPYYSGWIECKKCTADKVGIDPEQCAWAERHWRVSGRVWFAIRRVAKAGPRRKACDELHLIHGEGARHVMIGGLSACPPLYQKGSWAGGPARWDWQAIRAVLAS